VEKPSDGLIGDFNSFQQRYTIQLSQRDFQLNWGRLRDCQLLDSAIQGVVRDLHTRRPAPS